MIIHPIRTLWATSYLIETDEALFLVDAGFAGDGRAVLRRIRDIGRLPEELRFAVVTHAHPDHFGGLAELRDRAEFEIGCHADHVDTVAGGGTLYSPGLRPWSRAYMALARASLRFMRLRGASPVRSLADGERLDAQGLPGSIVHTPGHSAGCISLLLDGGIALTGDLVQGPRLPGASPDLPAMGDDPGRIVSSWRRLLDAGAHRFLPAHGGPVEASDLVRAMGRIRLSEAG